MIKKLLNPFNILDKKLLLIGTISLLIGSLLGFQFNSRFDGILDLHFVEKLAFYQPFLDLLISLLVISSVLFGIGKLINKKTRFIDLIIVGLIAKIPFYPLPLFNIGNKTYEISIKILELLNPKSKLELVPGDYLFLIFSTIFSFLAIIWSVVLLFNGFKTATNSKEIKHTLLFTLGIIVSEVISKTLIWSIN